MKLGFCGGFSLRMAVSFLAGELVEQKGVSNRLLATIAIAIIIVGIGKRNKSSICDSNI